VNLNYVGGAAQTMDQPTFSGGVDRDIASLYLVENVVGTAYADQLTGNGANDALVGGAGNDVLTGGAGSDSFAYRALNEGGDIITDFTAGIGGDKLDIKDLLVGYDPSASVLANFVQLSASGGSTIVSVDADGTGGAFSSTQICTLQGVTGVLLNDLATNGNLIVS